MFQSSVGLPATGVHTVRIGSSLRRLLDSNTPRSPGETAYHAFKYQLKPGSISESNGGSLEVADEEGTSDNVTIERHGVQNDIHVFTGGQQLSKDWECVLLYDSATESFVLEALQSTVTVKYSLAASKAAKRRRGEDGSPASRSSPTAEEPAALMLPRRQQNGDEYEGQAKPLLIGSPVREQGALGLDTGQADDESDDDFLARELNAAAQAESPGVASDAEESEAEQVDDEVDEVDAVAPPKKRRRLSFVSRRGHAPVVNGYHRVRSPSPPLSVFQNSTPPESPFTPPVVFRGSLPNGHVHSTEEDPESDSDSSGSESGSEGVADEDEDGTPRSVSAPAYTTAQNDEDEYTYDYLAPLMNGDDDSEVSDAASSSPVASPPRARGRHR